jgi:hypothetical protein
VPATFNAVIIFSVLIAPGYLLTQGINLGRNVDAERPDLHVLAKAVVASIIWLLLTWWWATEDLIRWLGDDSIDDHSALAAVWRGIVLVVLPYVAGRLIGAAVENNWRVAAPLLRGLGIASNHGTPWDFAWQRVAETQAPLIVVITLVDGTKVVGQFADMSRASVSPQAPEVYLEESYESKGEGLVVYNRGVHVAGSQIAAIAFKDAD